MIERLYSTHILDLAGKLTRRAITPLAETPRALIQAE